MNFFPKNSLVPDYWLLATILFSACLSSEYNVATHRQDMFIFSSESEVNMGRNIAQKISKEFTVSHSPDDIERVDKIGRRIEEVVDRKELRYYFHIIEKDNEGESQINAFSLPGGYVYIFKELLDLLDDDELAFVLAHEVGHIVSRHHIKRLQAAMGYGLVAIAAQSTKSGPQFNQGLSFALGQIMVAYSREDEFNADELAIKYCELAGFKAVSGIEAQEKLYQEGKKKTRPLSYFRTHPYTAQRIRQIKEALHLPLDVEDYIN